LTGLEQQTSSAKALLVAALAIGGSTSLIVAFAEYVWPRLPPWLSVIVYVLIAVAVIGYPIYALARWSNRRFMQNDGAAQQDKSR